VKSAFLQVKDLSAGVIVAVYRRRPHSPLISEIPEYIAQLVDCFEERGRRLGNKAGAISCTTDIYALLFYGLSCGEGERDEIGVARI
jgi:hypothetical protein